MKRKTLCKGMLMLSMFSMLSMTVPSSLTASASELITIEQADEGADPAASNDDTSSDSQSENSSMVSDVISDEDISNSGTDDSESSGSESSEAESAESESSEADSSEAESSEAESSETESSEAESSEAESSETESSESESSESESSETEAPETPAEEPQPEKKPDLVLVIDPGHDSTHDSTAIRYNGITYKEDLLNLAIARYLADELCTYEGVKVVMTRNTTACPVNKASLAQCLNRRVEVGKLYGAEAVISLHLNAGGGKGATVLVPNSNYAVPSRNHLIPEGHNLYTEGKGLAENIMNQLCSLGLYRRPLGYRNSTDSRYPDGSTADYYSIVSGCKRNGYLGIIIEHAFLDYTSDFNQFLSSESKLKALGVADATAIAKYYGLKKGTVKSSYITAPAVTPGSSVVVTPPAENQEATAETAVYQITASSLNVRSGPSTSYGKIGSLARGSKVSVVATSSGWGRITYNGNPGWISLSYCQKVVTTPPATDPKPVTPPATDPKPEVTPQQPASTGVKYKITASSLNVRTGAATSYSKLGTLSNGATVTVTEVKNNWGKISYNGKTGWISLAYAKKVDSDNTVSNVTTTNNVYQITASSLNVRSGAGTSYSKLGTLARNTKVTVLSVSNGWGKISYNGKTGWISLSYAKKIS